MTLDQKAYEKLPYHIRGGVQRYIEDGVPPGDFLEAVITNNLRESFARADSINEVRMYDIVGFFYIHAPIGCWGSEENRVNWIKKGGLRGGE